MTPTGHLAFEDSLSLRATVVKSAELDRTDTVVHFPLDARWLKSSHIAEVIEAVENSSHPVGISLAHNQDPLKIAGVAEGLQRIARLDEPVILFRTDLAGLDFLARDGMAATVGATSTLRHGIAPHIRGHKINVADRRSNLLWRPCFTMSDPRTLRTSMPTLLSQLVAAAHAAEEHSIASTLPQRVRTRRRSTTWSHFVRCSTCFVQRVAVAGGRFGGQKCDQQSPSTRGLLLHSIRGPFAHHCHSRTGRSSRSGVLVCEAMLEYPLSEQPSTW